jgi:serine protease Do
MSVGIVSATERSLPKLSNKENRLYSNLIQTTAQINPGNSGGPLFDLNGDVIGINTAVILPQKSTNGIGFAVPITPHVMACVQKLKQGEEVVYGYLGVTVSNLTARMRHELSLASVGARIDTIESDSPAGKGDLEPGDVVVEVNGELIRDADHFVRLIGFCPVDAPARMSLYRDGKPIHMDVPLRKRQLPTVAVTRQSQRLRWRGMLLAPVPAHWNEQSDQPPSGLMVMAVSETSPMITQGIKPGDILTAVAGRPVSTIPALHQLINEIDPSEWTVQLANTGTAMTSAAE